MQNDIVVCGAGTMGSGIALVAAKAGLAVLLYDMQADALERARIKIIQEIDLLTRKGKLAPEDKLTVQERIKFSSLIGDCVAPIVIEAIVEDLGIKVDLFNQLSSVNNADTIFATNTSSLAVTAIAEKINGAERLAGMHFFNPPTIMQLVEIISTPYTNTTVITRLTALAGSMQKIAVQCKDAPGFIVNHVARPYYLEALRLLEKGVSIETVDELLEAAGFRMGPFKLMDLIGNDINYTVSNIVYEGLGRPARLEPSALQRQKVEAGALGRKTGQGYYSYANTKNPS